MRVIFRLAAVLVLAAAVYLLWPIYTVLQIREAMRAGDTPTLTAKVDWEGVRTSLKASLRPEVLAAMEADPAAPKPSLWQRIKATLAPHFAPSVIDRHVTPENFPIFLGYRRMWRGTSQPVQQAPGEPTVLAGTWLDGSSLDRFIAFYARIRRAMFLTPTRFEIEVADKERTNRTFTGTLELRGWEWKLTGLTVSNGGAGWAPVTTGAATRPTGYSNEPSRQPAVVRP